LAPASRFPAAVEDASCAVRFLRAKALEALPTGLRGGPAPVAAWGEGEGAYLAMMLGVLREKDRFQGEGGHAEEPRGVHAVVSFYGPSDLSTWAPMAGEEPFLRQRYGKGSGALLADFVGSTDRKSPIYAKASPITYVTANDAPTLSIHGEVDPLVPIEQA